MKNKLWVGLLVLAAGSAGCSSNKADADDPSDEKRDAEDEKVVTADEIASMEGEDLVFDKEAADTVMKRGARKVGECVKEGAVPGEGEITAIFDGPKGRIVDVELGTFDEGSEQGKQCIKNSFIGEIIPPFKGEQRVPWNITIPEEKPAEGNGKKN